MGYYTATAKASKKWRQQFKDKGICYSCQKNKMEKNRSMCKDCLEEKRRRTKRNRERKALRPLPNMCKR